MVSLVNYQFDFGHHLFLEVVQCTKNTVGFLFRERHGTEKPEKFYFGKFRNFTYPGPNQKPGSIRSVRNASENMVSFLIPVPNVFKMSENLCLVHFSKRLCR